MTSGFQPVHDCDTVWDNNIKYIISFFPGFRRNHVWLGQGEKFGWLQASKIAIHLQNHNITSMQRTQWVTWQISIFNSIPVSSHHATVLKSLSFPEDRQQTSSSQRVKSKCSLSFFCSPQIPEALFVKEEALRDLWRGSLTPALLWLLVNADFAVPQKSCCLLWVRTCVTCKCWFQRGF